MECLAQAYFAGWTALIEFQIGLITFLSTLYRTTDVVTPLGGLHDIHNSSWALPYTPLDMSACFSVVMHFGTTLNSLKSFL